MRFSVSVSVLFCFFIACRSAEQPSSSARRQPRHDMAESLRADLAAERHPSDGGGRAWLEADGDAPPTATVSTPGRWVIHYEVGPRGIAEGGMIFLQVSPFWGWTTPQTAYPTAVGYTEVSTTAEGVALETETLDRQLLGITVGGRALEAGERVRMVYGAGPAGAVADRFAERDSRFWIAVDGDGDGIRQLLADSPGVEVLPGPPARLLLILPSTARPGESVRLTIAVVDGFGNAGIPIAGEVRLRGEAAGAVLPELIRLEPADRGHKTIELKPTETGTVRLEASGPEGLEAASNPLQVTTDGFRVLWGDLQNHSNFSDGSATPEDLFLYARDVAALDVVALTDHDHWGMLPLAQHPEMWAEIHELNERFHEPGRFVTILGWEWTNWVYGHRHVLYFDSVGEVLSSIDADYEHPEQLWEALRGKRAMTIAHHPAGGPVSIDWSIAPDPELEPVTEIVSVHGSSEALDSPSLIYNPVPGNFVRDALDRGYRFGFLGSSDGHDGHPGLAHLASPSGGLAAIVSNELTRDGVYEALRARRVYATNGPRILLRTCFGGYRLGAEIPVTADGGTAGGGPVPGIPPNTLVIQAIAPDLLSHVDVVRSGEVVQTVVCSSEEEEEERRSCSFALELAEIRAGEYLYVRVAQRDGGLAWSSPFYFVASSDPAKNP